MTESQGYKFKYTNNILYNMNKLLILSRKTSNLFAYDPIKMFLSGFLPAVNFLTI
jgi:hypothetical protein